MNQVVEEINVSKISNNKLLFIYHSRHKQIEILLHFEIQQLFDFDKFSEFTS